MSLSRYAKKLGISKSSLQDLEEGRRVPSPNRVAKIAKNGIDGGG